MVFGQQFKRLGGVVSVVNEWTPCVSSSVKSFFSLVQALGGTVRRLLTRKPWHPMIWLVGRRRLDSIHTHTPYISSPPQRLRCTPHTHTQHTHTHTQTLEGEDSSDSGSPEPNSEEAIFSLLFQQCDSDASGLVQVDQLVEFIRSVQMGGSHPGDQVYDSHSDVSSPPPPPSLVD